MAGPRRPILLTFLSYLIGTVMIFSAGSARAFAGERIHLANNPALSPDGKTLVFDWKGDLWSVPIAGGKVERLTSHGAKDVQPKFSPDGKTLAFVSDRGDSPQVYTMPARGGAPRQLTFHTAGFSLSGFTPDGNRLLVQSHRDHFWRHAERFFLLSSQERGPETLLFDDYGTAGDLSPDGRKLLFTRESEPWWRLGYRGSQASQVWLFDLVDHTFEKILHEETGCRSPLWRPDGKGFYFVRGQGDAFNLFEFDFSTAKRKQLTSFTQGAVVMPALARAAGTLVFRHLFDLYALDPRSPGSPRKIDLLYEGDLTRDSTQRRSLSRAASAGFTSDGLEIALIVGSDLWVMDTELREPVRITRTGGEERSPVFAPGNQAIYYVSEHAGKSDIFKAERQDAKKPWFLNETFKVSRLTSLGDVAGSLSFSPDGKTLAFVRSRGDLCLADADGKNERILVASWNSPDFDWSPDGKWIVFGKYDDDFNRDVFVVPVDGSMPPRNIANHPYNEASPVWSPDGRMIAFSGSRAGGAEAADLVLVRLRRGDDEKDSRAEKLKKALEKIQKVRSGGKGGSSLPPGKKLSLPNQPPAVVLDFEGLKDRIRRVPLGKSRATNLMWSPDSKRLAFTASIDDKAGTYLLDVEASTGTPKLLTTATGSQAQWLARTNQIVWLANGVPGAISPAAGAPSASPTPAPAPTGFPRKGFPRPTIPAPTGSTSPAPANSGTAYTFQVVQEYDVAERNQAIFDQCWRVMRDHWYDERLGNKDWNQVRARYAPMAAVAADVDALTVVIQLMLGELNGSHLGFLAIRGAQTPPPKGPVEPSESTGTGDVTAHLGVRFDQKFGGPGLLVRDVLPGGPAALRKSELHAGEVVLRIDGKEVSRATDLTTVLNGRPDRTVLLRVKAEGGKERDVALRPISFVRARQLLYRKWLDDNRAAVDRLSGGKLGYLHIAAMNMPSFHKFEEELFSIAGGKDGLIIDVRENGGGSTTDHLLTVLNQPVHAVAVPRGGGPGYPQDRKVYAAWNKPIIVLCNQNSFSNAEIFSHAVKTLKRGQVVGVPTAGGVVSTGSVRIMDAGMLRLPFRGWFLLDSGEDMELHGAVPHHVLWPAPEQMPRGRDVQLEKAVEELSREVAAWRNRTLPKLKRATERR